MSKAYQSAEINTGWIDSHCHLDFDALAEGLDQEVQACRDLGCRGIVLPATTAASWTRVAQLARRYDLVSPAFGLHPYFMHQHSEEDLEALAGVLDGSGAVAVGELGLDYQLPDYDAEAQKKLVAGQLAVADEAGLPVILHARKSHDELLKLLRQRRWQHGGILHAFSGSEQQARHWIDAGFKLGFGGAVTYPRARKLRRLVATLPLEAIVLETDAPDMPPAFIERGEANRPSHLPGIARIIAELRDIPVEALAEQTSQNAIDALSLKCQKD
ncbi:MAG: TatD family hydrolase [Pseudomonadota bacterium]